MGIGLIIGGLITAVTEFLGPLGTAILVSAVSSGISYTISALTQPKPPGPLSSNIDRVRNIQRDPQAPGRVYYGHGFGSGYLVYARVTNKEGNQKEGARYLHICLIIAVGPISGVTKIYLNDEKDLTPFHDLISFIPFVGASDQTMFRGPVGIKRTEVQLPEEWLRADRPLSGIAYIWGTMAAHPTVFPGGPPSIRMEIDGSIVYDPRDSTQNYFDPYSWSFTNNWAVCIYNYLTNTEYGRGARPDQICGDCFLEAANWSDDLVEAPSQKYTDAEGKEVIPKIKRYTLDGSFETNEQPVDIMSTLAAAGAGTITFYDGKWHIRAGMPRATLLDIVTGEKVILTPDNLRDDDSIMINVRPGRKEAANIVRGSYISASDLFTAQDFPQQTHPDFVKEDGGIDLVSNLELPFCLDVDRAQRLARISLYMGRLGMRVTFPGGPELLQIPPWEVIELCFPEYGWGEFDDNDVLKPNIPDPTDPTNEEKFTYKQFYVADRTLTEAGAVNLILAEYSNSMYSDTINPALLPVRGTLPSAFDVFPPENVILQELVHTNLDGTRVAKLRLSWGPPHDGYADTYLVSWRNIDGLLPFMSRVVDGTATMTEIIGLEAGQYEVQIQTRVGNKLSEIISVLGNVTYRTLPPPTPIHFRVSLQITGTRQFSWDVPDGVEPPDLRGYEIRFVKEATTVPAWDDARIFLRDIRRRVVETRQPVAEGNYYFLLKSLDLTGMYSTDCAVAQIYISPREATDLANREYSEEQWPGVLADCTVSNNELVGASQSSWNQTPTWNGMDTWAKGKARLIYTPPVISLATADFATFEFKVEGRGVQGFYVQSRWRTNTGDEYTPFKFVTGAMSQHFQFRLIAWNDGIIPIVIEKFYVTLRAKDETDQVLAYDMSTDSDRPITRVEGISVLASTGEVSHINATAKGISLDVASWLRLSGTGYVVFPELVEPAFQTTGTIEFTFHITAYTQQGRLLGRGNSWSVDYTYESFDSQAQGVIRFNSSFAGFTPIAVGIGNALGIYEVVIVNDNSVISMYVNRKYVGSSSTVVFPYSTDPVVFGARILGGSAANYIHADAKELRIWRTILTDEEIGAISGISVNPDSMGLIGYWKFDDNFSVTTVAEDRTTGNHDGITFNATRVRIGARMSPTIDLAIFPLWGALKGEWEGALPSGTTIAVYMGIGEGDREPRAWSILTNPASPYTVPSLDPYSDPLGYKVWCLQVLSATDVTKTPTLSKLTTTMLYPAAVGDLVIQPPHPFSTIRQVLLSVRSDNGTTPLGWNLVAHDPVAARFAVYDPTVAGTVPRDAVVDVLFRGSRIY